MHHKPPRSHPFSSGELCLGSSEDHDTSGMVSIERTYPTQQHARFKLLWCLQHLSDGGAKALNSGRQWLLWTHFLQSDLSLHSLNLFLLSSSCLLHLAQFLLNELFLPRFVARTRP